MNKKINFSELVELLARQQNCPKREAENFLRELVNLMSDAISSGEVLRINGLGVFKPIWVEARSSVNVQTGEPYVIPGHYKLSFTPAKSVREAVNEPFACFCVEELPDDAPLLNAPGIVDEIETENAEGAVGEIVEPVVEEMPEPTPPSNEASIGESTPNESKSEQALPENQTSILLPSQDIAEVEPEKTPTEEFPQQELLDEKPQTPDEIEIDSQEATVTPDTSQDTLPVVPDDLQEVEEEADDTPEVDTSNAYRRGLWVGVAVTAIIAIVAMLLMYTYFAHYNKPQVVSQEQVVSVVEPITVVDTLEQAYLDTLPIVDTTTTAIATPEEPQVVVTDTVRRGVFLTNVSYKHYGHKAFWVYIYEENKDIINNPDNVPVGTVITIPPAAKYGIDANDTTAVKVALAKADTIKMLMKK